jgi:hypothetical protein
MVRRLVGTGVDVYLNVNNHFEGCAPLTIDRIRALLGEPGKGPGLRGAGDDIE